MKCPKCGLEQAESNECSGCGIIIAKYVARQQNPSSANREKKNRRLQSRVRYGPLKRERELEHYYQSQATLLGAGLSARDGHANFLSNPGQILDLQPYRRIAEALEEGRPISDGMTRSPDYFPAHHVRLVQAGEQSGHPEDMFDRLQSDVARYIGVIEDVNRELRKPKITVYASFFLMPLPSLFSSGLLTYLAGSALPLILLFVTFWILKAVYQRLSLNESFATGVDEKLLSIPIYRKFHINQFIRVLSATYRAGMPVADAYAVAASVTSNRFLFRVLDSHQPLLEEGRTLTEVCRETGAFRSDILQVISTGETAGELDKSLDRYADGAEEEFNRSLKRQMTVLTTVISLCIALYIGFRIVSAYSALLPKGLPPIQ